MNGRTINSVGAELMVLIRSPQGWKISAIHLVVEAAARRVMSEAIGVGDSLTENREFTTDLRLVRALIEGAGPSWHTVFNRESSF